MYNIFYIYNYKYIKPSNTLTLSLSQCPHGQRLHKQLDRPHSQEQTASRAYMAKCTNRIMYQDIQLATFIYTAILKNCIMRSMFQFVTVL